MKKDSDTISYILDQKNIPIKELEKIEDICIHVVDSSGNIICYSKGCEKIENMSHVDVIGKKSKELYEYIENDSMQDHVLKSGKTVLNEHVKYKTLTGKVADVISSTYPIFSTDGCEKIVAAMCFYRDISDYMNMAVTINKLQSELKTKTLKANGTQFTFRDIVGSSCIMQECITQGKVASQTMAPVLITGPTGSGKEVFSQSIHNDGERENMPFIAINCSAIPENLLESSLFGTVKGAYTGAVDTKGLIESAKGGTLFLDELNSMNMTLQSKLLRVLETKKYRKVGSNKESEMDVRIISALNKDPQIAIDNKELRSDLYYRLAVFTLNLPSLENHKSDIPEFIELIFSSECAAMGKKLCKVSNEALSLLMQHDWPGNMRELKHAIIHAIYMAKFEETILVTDLLPDYLKKLFKNKTACAKYITDPEKERDLKLVLMNVEKEFIKEVLKENDFNISKSAQMMNISRQNLQYKIRRYQIKIK